MALSPKPCLCPRMTVWPETFCPSLWLMAWPPMSTIAMSPEPREPVPALPPDPGKHVPAPPPDSGEDIIALPPDPEEKDFTDMPPDPGENVHPATFLQPTCPMPAPQLLQEERALWTMPTSKPWVSSGHFTQGADPPCICLEGASGVMPFGGCGFCYVFSHQALHAVPLSKHRSSQLYGAHYCLVMFLFTLPHMFLFWFKSCLQPCLDIGCLPNVSWLLSLSPVFLCSL